MGLGAPAVRESIVLAVRELVVLVLVAGFILWGAWELYRRH